MRALLVGKTMTGMRVYDLLQVINYASGRADVDAARIDLTGKGTAGATVLYAAVLQPRVRKVIVQDAIPSYMDIVRAKVYRDDVVDLIVPGVVRDFDLPDLAKAMGRERVVIVNPQTPNGAAMTSEQAAREYGPSVRIVKTAAALRSYFQE